MGKSTSPLVAWCKPWRMQKAYDEMIGKLFVRFPSFQKTGASAYKPGIAYSLTGRDSSGMRFLQSLQKTTSSQESISTPSPTPLTAPMTGNPSGFLTAHQDWTDTITAASANAYNEAIAQIPPQFDPTYISGVIDLPFFCCY